MFYMRLFKNDNREAGDNRPIYSNSNFTVKERVVLEPGQAYTIAMWKDKDKDRDSLNIKMEEKKEKPAENTSFKPSGQDDDIPF